MRLRKDGQPDRRAGRAMPKGEACCNYKHGYATGQKIKSPEYRTWRAMKSRCLNPNDPAYDRYGGRGIAVDPRWADSFEVFIADMGARPEGMTLDRIDNDGDYTKTNCRWATRKEQAANKRSTFLVEIGGEVKCLAVWCSLYKLDPAAVHYRVRKFGWSYAEAIVTPKMRKRSNRYA